MRTWTGKAVSPGFAEGTAVVYTAGSAHVVPRYRIEEGAVAEEQTRLNLAIAAAREDLERLRREVTAELGASDAAIFASHVAFLDDRSFRAKIESRIASEKINAEQALEAEATDIADALSRIEDEYLRERAQDIRDVTRRIMGHLSPSSSRQLTALPADAVIVARELLPSETACLDRRHVRALITEEGSKTSHAAILAKALGIPAVTGVTRACEHIVPGCRVLVDGTRGKVMIAPSASARATFERDRDAYRRVSAVATEMESAECCTQDGTVIELHANLGRIAEASDVRVHHLSGVGLFRTEVLFMQSDSSPTLKAQETAYRRVAEELDGLPLVIRTFDLGGDKQPGFLTAPSEHNPNIGLRGLRFALREDELFRTQLAAILHVARDHPVSVLFPMVVAGDDLLRAIEIMHQVAAEHDCPTRPSVGAMIETPSSIFALPEIVRACDFLSIGTNDLTQFMLAADRDAVDLLDEFSILHPSVLRAVDMIIEEAAAADLPVSICGEAAGDPDIAPLLVGLGIRRLSMSPMRAARVRMALRQCRLDTVEAVAREALGCTSVDTVLRRLGQSAIAKPRAE
jgi:phosphoenolpyruvate-protein phosphotransferase